MRKYFLTLLLFTATVGAIPAQTIMEVAGVPGESNYPFAQAVHSLDLADFDDARQTMTLALKPPSGYTPAFQIAVKKTPGLASPKFAEALLKNSSFSTITIKQYQNGQITTMVKMEGARINAYALSSDNYDEFFTIKANKVWYEEPPKKYRVGYDFVNQVQLK